MAAVSNNGAPKRKNRDFTDEHAAACVRAKEELEPISDREIRELILDHGELYGVTFARVPSRQRINNWTREAKLKRLIENGEAITIEMLRGRGTALLWAALDRAEALLERRPVESAEIVAVVGRAARHWSERTRASQPPKPKKTVADEGAGSEAPTVERMREQMEREGQAIADASDDPTARVPAAAA